MPKASKHKVYAVKVGREGPKIYTTWEEAKDNVSRYPGAVHKSFNTRLAAEQWLGPMNNMPQTNHNVPLQLPTPEPTPLDTYASPPPAYSEAYHSTGYRGSNHEAPTEAVCAPRGIPIDPPIKLSSEQQDVLDKVKRGESVFFTGAAGTGKSVLLREIIRWCREEGQKRLAVTASTGIAGVNIGGSTLHSWAGIGLGQEPAAQLVGKILGLDRRRRLQEEEQRRQRANDDDDEFDEEPDENNMTKKSARLVQRWREVHILIIDEISMIDGVLFDKLEFVARALRKNKKPFGGIQLVLSGDFCQLPPVGDRNSKLPPLFAFEARTWESCIGKSVTLQKVFRQKEQAFVDMLNDMRFGVLPPPAVKAFMKLSREVLYDDGITPTELFPTKVEVEGANMSRLNKIKEDAHQYNAVDIPGWDEKGDRVDYQTMEKLLGYLVVQKTVILKVGAQVMLIKNLVQGELVNGSIGLVVGFASTREALNRGASLGVAESSEKPGTSEAPRNLKSDETSDQVKEHLKSPKKWPVVKFGDREVLCVPAQFEVNNADGKVQARRDQVPLILAWALSIHKSQGQTLERVRVNMGRIFEKGQAYVAISRATSIERLQVLHFDPAKVQAHPRVMEWMKHHGYDRTALQADSPSQDAIDEDIEFWGDDLH